MKVVLVQKKRNNRAKRRETDPDVDGKLSLKISVQTRGGPINKRCRGNSVGILKDKIRTPYKNMFQVN